MSDNQVIPEAAVDEVAHLVWREGRYSTPWAEWNKDRWRRVAREILEVAAPHMLADAWDAGRAQGVRFPYSVRGFATDDNPYRSAT